MIQELRLLNFLQWIAETEIFELDQVTENMVRSFLRLLGQEPQKGEKLKEAKLRAQMDLRKLYRAVTLEDFERLAVETSSVDIACAKAFWSEDIVQIVVLPESLRTKKKQQEAMSDFEVKKRVSRHLDKRRILTTLIEVTYPEYIEVSVQTVVKIKHNASKNGVEQRAKETLDFFDPFRWLLEEMFMLLR